jgi:cell division protein FtsW
VVGEELGFLGCLAVVGLFGYLFCRGVKAAVQSPMPLFNWLGLGLITLIILEAMINTSMVINLGPTKGIPLPFISMGGTSLMINLVAMGVVINISREYPE